MEEIHVHLREISLHDEAQIPSGVADAGEQEAVKWFEVPRQTHFQSRFDDRTNERSEAGIGILDVEPVAGAAEADRQHASSMPAA